MRPEVAKALNAMPEEFAEWVHRAGYAGAGGVGITADRLVEYVAARLLTDDPLLERRDTWSALRTAADVAFAHVEALEARRGESVRVWVEYLGVGYRFTAETDGAPDTGAWFRAFALALVFDLPWLDRLTGGSAKRLPDGPRALLARALADLHAGRPVDPDGVDSPTLAALVAGDRDECDRELRAAFARHEEDHQGRLRDLLPWDLLALAILARRGGVPVATGSVHCPLRLVSASGPRQADPNAPVRRPAFHERYVARMLERLDADAPGSVERLLETRRNQGWLAQEFVYFAQERMRAFALRSLSDPDADDPWQWTELVLAQQASAAAFRLLAAEPGTFVEVTIGDQSKRVPADGPGGYGGGSWNYINTLGLAMAVRAHDDLAALARMPDAVAGPSPVARALRDHLAGRAHREHLDEVLGRGVVHRDDWDCLELPLARLLDRRHHEDRDRAMAEALDLYRQYHSVGERREEPEGLVPLPLLGLACRAHDAGGPVAVESDYLPRRIVDGSWLGTPIDLTAFRRA